MKEPIKTRKIRTYERNAITLGEWPHGRLLYEIIMDALPTSPFNEDGRLQCFTDGYEIFVTSEAQAEALANILELCDHLIYNTGDMADLGGELPVWYVQVDEP